MPQELLNAFIGQLIESLDGISEALRILQQYCQTEMEDAMTEKAQMSDIGTETVREMLIQKSKEGKADRIREILTLFNAERISDVDPAKYPELIKMVSGL